MLFSDTLQFERRSGQKQTNRTTQLLLRLDSFSPPLDSTIYMSTLFFYGTLIHPAVLARVTGSDGAHLETRAAVLHQHTRHHVKGEGTPQLRRSPLGSLSPQLADYPAVVPASAGRAILLGRDLTQDEASVRGSLVTGLTADEVAFLDEFEGDVSRCVWG